MDTYVVDVVVVAQRCMATEHKRMWAIVRCVNAPSYSPCDPTNVVEALLSGSLCVLEQSRRRLHEPMHAVRMRAHSGNLTHTHTHTQTDTHRYTYSLTTTNHTQAWNIHTTGRTSHSNTIKPTQTHKHTNTQTHKHTNTQTHKHTNTQHTNTQTHKHTNTQTHKHTHTQHYEKHTYIHTHTNRTCSVRQIVVFPEPEGPTINTPIR